MPLLASGETIDLHTIDILPTCQLFQLLSCVQNKIYLRPAKLVAPPR